MQCHRTKSYPNGSIRCNTRVPSAHWFGMVSMNRDLFDALAALSPMDPSNQQTTACKICGEEAWLFDVVDFNKCCSPGLYDYGFSGIAVSYYRCRLCGFAFSRFFDDWTQQDFVRFIYNSDYIKVDRNYAGVRHGAWPFSWRSVSRALRTCEFSTTAPGRASSPIICGHAGSAKCRAMIHSRVRFARIAAST